MKQLITMFCIAIFTIATLSGCGEEAPAPKTETAKPSAQSAPAAPEVPAAAPGKTGKVLQTMDAAGYTYIEVDTGTEKFWAAAPQFGVKVDDDVVVPEGMPMPDYHSKTLDRTFELVYFVPNVLVGGAESITGGMPEGHPPMDGSMGSTPGSSKAPATEIDMTGIEAADQTVADVFEKKADLSGKPVKIRGKVVKFSPEIMGKNWIHLQDGTGAAGTNDLTVTTSGMAKVGDTVVISGLVVTDKDFGYGYAYDVMIEDAEVTVEQ